MGALAVAEYQERVLQEGIWDFPDDPEWAVGEHEAVPQMEEEAALGIIELEKGLQKDSQMWKELSKGEEEVVVWEGYMVSSAFVDRKGVDDDGSRKGRLVQSFKRQSTWWNGTSVRMERAAEFAAATKPGGHFISFDVKAGYRQYAFVMSKRVYWSTSPSRSAAPTLVTSGSGNMCKVPLERCQKRKHL